MPVELPELVITSKTQSPETIKKILEDQGYKTADFEVEGASDGPPVETPPAEEPLDPETPPVTDPPPPEVPAGAPPAGDDDDEEEEAPPVTPPAPPAAGQEPPKKKPGSVKLKEKLQTQVQENIALKAEVERLKTLAPAAPVVTAPPPAEPAATEPDPVLRPKPVWADFENEEDQNAALIDAVVEWNIDKRDFDQAKAKRAQDKIEAPAREAAKLAETEQAQVFETWKTRTTPVKERHTDFDQKITAIPPSPVMAAVVMREEDGPELAYWLADNPDELLHLNELTKTDGKSTPAQIQTAMGKMHQALGRIRYIISQEGPSGEEPNREVPPTTPPPPVTPVPPAAAAPVGAPPPKKATPVAPVGARGASPNKTLAQMTPDEIRTMAPDEYRRRVEKGERFN